MELYAGMVENLDYHIGRLIDHLKKIGEYDNTIFIVFGDNGAEGTDLFEMIAGTPGTRDFLFAAINWSQTNPKAWGDPGSYVGYGPMWAQVSMTPFSQYKGWMAEGGIRNALIVSGPVVERPKGSINGGLMHVADIMPTLLEIAGDDLSQTPDGRRVAPADRKVMGPAAGGPGRLAAYRRGLPGVGAVRQPRRAAGRLEDALGVQAVWARATGSCSTLQPIPAERKDLAAENPDKVKALLALWDDYVKDNNVILPEPLGVRDAGRPVAAACAGRRWLPAADLQAAVRTAQRHDGGAQAVSTDARINATKRRSLHEHRAELMHPVAGLRSIALPGRRRRAVSAAGILTGAGALLLEDAVGRERGSAHRQVDQRQHQSVRLRAHRDAGSRHSTVRWRWSVTRAPSPCSTARPWSAILLPMGRVSGDVTRGRPVRSRSRPAASATRPWSSTST